MREKIGDTERTGARDREVNGERVGTGSKGWVLAFSCLIVFFSAVIIRRQICSHTRHFGTSGFKKATNSLVVASAFGVGFSAFTAYAYSEKPDYNKVKEAVKGILDEDNYDDGSIGPVLLAWHASGTYDAKTKTGEVENSHKAAGDVAAGGSDGATMRFTPEAGTRTQA
eukprot:763954-Hanusia_phi.AAC.4